ACSPRSGSECLNRDDPNNRVLAGRAQRQVRHLLQRRGVRRFYGSLCLGSPYLRLSVCATPSIVYVCAGYGHMHMHKCMYISMNARHPSRTHTTWNALAAPVVHRPSG
ncbi:MAG: hypothetical protein ACK55Z_25415, partial [bacterium]